MILIINEYIKINIKMILIINYKLLTTNLFILLYICDNLLLSLLQKDIVTINLSLLSYILVIFFGCHYYIELLVISIIVTIEFSFSDI